MPGFKFSNLGTSRTDIEKESCGIEFVQMEFVVCKTICIIVDGVNSGQ